MAGFRFACNSRRQDLPGKSYKDLTIDGQQKTNVGRPGQEQS